MEATASYECFLSNNHGGDGGDTQDCSMSLKQGIAYSVMNQKTDVSLQQLFPIPTATRPQHYQHCALADHTGIEQDVHDDDDDDHDKSARYNKGRVPFGRSVDTMEQPVSPTKVIHELNATTDLTANFVSFHEPAALSTATDVNGISSTDNGNSKKKNYKSNNMVSIERTIQRPHGVTNSGTLWTTIRNDHSEGCSLTLTVTEIIPSYLQPTLMEWKHGGMSVETKATRTAMMSTGKSGRDRTDDSLVVEHHLSLQGHHEASLRLGYDPVLLPFERFPADPNRGMELPPAIVRVDEIICQTDRDAITVSQPALLFYSDSLLFMPPVPDMSMPFNILSLTCTFYVCIFGTILNMLVRRGSEAVKFALHPELRGNSKTKDKSKMNTLTDKLRRLFFRQKATKVVEEDIEPTPTTNDNKTEQDEATTAVE